MTRSDIEKAVREALATLTDADTSTLSSTEDLGAAIGLDSLGRLELLADVEDRFDLMFVDAEVENANTIKGMVDAVVAELNKEKELA